MEGHTTLRNPSRCKELHPPFNQDNPPHPHTQSTHGNWWSGRFLAVSRFPLWCFSGYSTYVVLWSWASLCHTAPSKTTTATENKMLPLKKKKMLLSGQFQWAVCVCIHTRKHISFYFYKQNSVFLITHHKLN